MVLADGVSGVPADNAESYMPSSHAAKQPLPAIVSGSHVKLVPEVEDATQYETDNVWRSGKADARKQTGFPGSASTVLRRLRQELLSGLTKPVVTSSCNILQSQAAGGLIVPPGGLPSQALDFTARRFQHAGSAPNCCSPSAGAETAVISMKACAETRPSEGQPACARVSAAGAGLFTCSEQQTLHVKSKSMQSPRAIRGDHNTCVTGIGQGHCGSGHHSPPAEATHNQMPAPLPTKSCAAELGTADVDRAAAGVDPGADHIACHPYAALNRMALEVLGCTVQVCKTSEHRIQLLKWRRRSCVRVDVKVLQEGTSVQEVLMNVWRKTLHKQVNLDRVWRQQMQTQRAVQVLVTVPQ